MTQEIRYKGTVHRFPDDWDQDKISTALQGWSSRTQQEGEDKRLRQESGSFFRGIPVLGAYEPQMGAAISATAAPFTGISAPGVTAASPWQERYEAFRKKYMGEKEEFEQQHPYVEAGGNVLGGVTSLAGLGSIAPVARLMGMAPGQSMGQMVTRGAGSLGAITGADVLARGEDDLKSGLIKTGVGAAAGAAGPVAGRLISFGVDRAGQAFRTIGQFSRAVRDPDLVAQADVARAVERGQQAPYGSGLKQHEIEIAEQMGLPITNVERAGESGRALLRSAANQSTEARDVIRATVLPRYAERQQRMTQWLRERLNFPDAQKEEEAIRRAMRTENSARYDKAMAEGDFLISEDHPEMQQLMGADVVQSAMQRAIKSVKDEEILRGFGAFNQRPQIGPGGAILPGRSRPGPVFPNLRYWDQVRQELHDIAWRAGRGTNEYRRAMDFATQLNKILDDMVPSYKAAREGAARLFGERDMLRAGQKAAGSKMTGEEIRTKLKSASHTEKQLFQDGYADAFIKRAENNFSALGRLKQVAERERLEAALGPQFAKELEVYMQIENAMNLTKHALDGNSTTIRQLVELGLVGGGITELGLGGFDWKNPQSMIGAFLLASSRFGVRKLTKQAQEQVSNNIARILVSNNPQDFQRGVRFIAERPDLLNGMRNFSARLGDVGTRAMAERVIRKPRLRRPGITEGSVPEYQGMME